MGTDAENLTGIWQGRHSYPFGPSVSFVATLIDSGGSFTGSTHEPCSFDSGRTIFAMLEGSLDGRVVSFLKRYQDAGPLYAATVKYRGTLSQDATEIAGRWAILAIFSGKFVMTRLPGKAAEVEHKQSELV
jgi:hypothetical protein